ncbi:MAG: HEAT repeat domain-containing protein [Verrucomicrobia bacterium]|nr:HEAT repeat domain-containing protein [Verrucomicrobiota bacterium]
MNKPHFAVFLMVFTVFIASLGSACAKKETVNVSAQTAGLKSPDKDTRINACIELAKAGPKAASAVSDLIPILKDQDAEVRRLAAYALYEIGEGAKAAIPAVKELMNDRDPAVVQQALNTLRAIDPTAKDLQAPPNVTTGVKP